MRHAKQWLTPCCSSRIVTGSHDRTLKVWDADTGEELLTLEGHTGPVMSVCFSPGGDRIISGSSDNTIRFWDTIAYEPSTSVKQYLAAPKPARHRQQAERLESEGQLHAALFHRAWLLKIQPQNPNLYDQLHATHDRWQATRNDRPIALPTVVREMLQAPRGP